MNSTKKYAGNPYTCSNTISMAAAYLFLFLFFLIKSRYDKAAIYAIPISLLIVFLLYMIDMNYFIIDNGDLVIKNHCLPWKRKVVPLINIKEFETKRHYNRSRALRIVTKDHHTKLFCAGSLRKQDWRSLVNALKNRGVQKIKFSEQI